MTTRTEHPTIETITAQIDEIQRNAMTLIEHLQAERDTYRDALQQIAEHPRQPLGDARQWAYRLHAIACKALTESATSAAIEQPKPTAGEP